MNCEKCDDTGYRYDYSQDDLIPVMVLCDCAAATRRRYPGIPEMALDWTFDNFPASLGSRFVANGKPIGISIIRRAFTERDRWIVFSGPVGTGKTSLAISGYKVLRDAHVNGRYWNATALFDAAKASFGNPDRVNPIEQLYVAPDLLILDGLGERILTKWEAGAAAQMLGQRYAHRLRTVITTNWAPEEFRERLGDWVFDRLMSEAIIITVTGKSMRGRAT